MKPLVIDYIGESTSRGYSDGIDHADDVNYCIPLMLQKALNDYGYNCIVNNLAKDSVSVDWCLGIKDGDESSFEPNLIINPPGSAYNLAKSKANIVVISLGINDALYCKIDEFVRDFRILIDNCRIAGKKTYVVIPNKINDSENNKLFAVASCVKQIAHEKNIIVIGDSLQPVPLSDLYHPTAEGYQQMSKAIIKSVSADMQSVVNHKTIAGMYAALFDQGPEKSGLDYWSLELNTMSRDVVAQSIINNMHNVSDLEFIGLIYDNLLNKEPDKEGLDYWLDKIALSSRGTALNEIIDIVSSEAAPQDIQDTFQNKISVGLSNGYIFGNEEKVDLIGVTCDFNSVYDR